MPGAAPWLQFVLALTLLSGCTSLQYSPIGDRPSSVGLAWERITPGARGYTLSILAPGVSLRLGSRHPALTIGLSETTFFYPGSSEAVSDLVALQEKSWGLGIASDGVSFGYARSFGVCMEGATEDVVQLVDFSESALSRTVVLKEPLE